MWPFTTKWGLPGHNAEQPGIRCSQTSKLLSYLRSHPQSYCSRSLSAGSCQGSSHSGLPHLGSTLGSFSPSIFAVFPLEERIKSPTVGSGKGGMYVYICAHVCPSQRFISGTFFYCFSTYFFTLGLLLNSEPHWLTRLAGLWGPLFWSYRDTMPAFFSF